MNVSIFLVSVVDFLISPVLDTAHDGVGFFTKYFHIPGYFVCRNVHFLR